MAIKSFLLDDQYDYIADNFLELQVLWYEKYMQYWFCLVNFVRSRNSNHSFEVDSVTFGRVH